MSICSNCYESQITIKHDVGHWWNNPPDHVFVCSDKCYKELEQHVKNRTWMDRKPVVMFGESKKVTKGLTALTDKQFGTT
jgi:hypothetical protein